MAPFKNKTADDLYTFEEVKSFPEYAGILGEETILIDVDDAETSDILFQIVQDLGLKCRVYATSRGKHFLFRNIPELVKSNRTKATLAIGFEADLKIGSRNSYQILKYGRVRESNARLSDRLQEVKLENKALRQVSADYERVKRAFGPEQVKAAVQADKQREQAEKGRKRPRHSLGRNER